MKKLITTTIILLCTLIAYAETAENRKENPHQIRIGIADDLVARGFETTMMNDNLSLPPAKEGYHITGFDEYNYRSTGHLYVEYLYRINHWLGVGANFDTRTSLWQRTDYSICPQESIVNTQNHHGVGLILAPTVRFTYYDTPYASLYASVSIGAQMQTYDNIIENIYLAVDLCYFGVSLGKNHWFCDLELGLAYGPAPFDRLFRFAVGYRF